MKFNRYGLLCHLIALTIVASLGGCTAGSDGENPSPRPATSMPETPSTLPLPEVEAPPGPQPGMKTLLTVSPTSGGVIAGTVQAEAGAIWVNADCIGGILEIILNDEMRLPITCSETEITPSGNRIGYSSARQLTVRVEASPEVHWSMRIEQEDSTDEPD